MSLDVVVDLARYPDLTLAQSAQAPGVFNPRYSLHIPLKDIPNLFWDVLNKIPTYEKARISIHDKVLLAKQLGLDYVYRGPDIARACVFTAGICLIAAGLAEEKIVKQAIKSLAICATSCLPALTNNSFIQNVINLGNTAQEHKILSGSVIVMLTHATSKLSESQAKCLDDLRNGVISIFKSVGSLIGSSIGLVGNAAHGIADGAMAIKEISGRAFSGYVNGWRNHTKSMTHVHAFTSIAAVLLYSLKKE